ncbi:tau 95 subunit of transcription factor TFIIIC [Onygenales sp. PD_12]|nr:tau 95 subunit of transcription factor TFIIIC [Onygenales sp. PD_12]
MSKPRTSRDRSAPWYPIPAREIVSVEHPCVVKNIDKGIQTLDGSSGISKILNPPRNDASANLYLRPEDGMARPLSSTCNQANNVLLKITVPKRTGRKRKRGSSEPFGDQDGAARDSSAASPTPTARDLGRRLKDNVGKYEIEAVGKVERMHVFRGMPDFVYSTTASPFMTQFREKILPFEYEKLKQYQFDMSKGATSNVDIIPPPALSRGDVPFNYLYRQNPTVKQSIGPSGEITTTNTQQVTKVLTHLVAYDVATVPSAPRENCPPIPTLDKTLQETIAALNHLFEKRVAWTRRGLRNSLPTNEQKYALRLAVPYVGYIFRSGPWRDAIIRFGHDPRTDPGSCIYQTFMFRLMPSTTTEQAENNNNNNHSPPPPDGAAGTGTITTSISNRRHTIPRLPSISDTTTTPSTNQTQTHLFTGRPPLARDGKMWMICDITDPLLARILAPPTPPATGTLECDIASSGWYGNVILAIAKTVMRAKIQHLLEHNRQMDDGDFLPLLEFPERVGGDEEIGRVLVCKGRGGGVGVGVGARSVQLATEVRAMVRGAPGWKGVRREGGGGGGGVAKKVKWEDEGVGEEEGEAVVEGEIGDGDGDVEGQEEEEEEGEGEGDE